MVETKIDSKSEDGVTSDVNKAENGDVSSSRGHQGVDNFGVELDSHETTVTSQDYDFPYQNADDDDKQVTSL